MMGLRVKRSLGDAAVSVGGFLAVLVALLVADDQARERVMQTVSDGRAAAWGSQASGLISVVIDAARDQSIAHAPLLIFVLVAGFLLLLMLRT